MTGSQGLLAVFDDVYARWLSHRANSRTRRIVQNLPRHIRKDIGWPEVTLSDWRDRRWR